MTHPSEDPAVGRTLDEPEEGDAFEVSDDVDQAETALLGDIESMDEVDTTDERWAPGEPSPDLPADEVLRVHTLSNHEPTADVLDVGCNDLELPVPDEDEPPHPAGEAAPDDALHRTRLRRDPEVREERLDTGVE